MGFEEMRLSTALLAFPLMACSTSPFSEERASEELYAQLRADDLSQKPIGYWNGWKIMKRVARSNQDILHLGHYSDSPLSPGATRYSVVVGLERQGIMKRLTGRDVWQTLSESPCNTPAEAEILSLALASPLMISLAEFPEVKTIQISDKTIVSVQFSGFYNTIFTDEYETIDTLTGRRVEFHWRDGNLAEVKQAPSPELTLGEEIEARSTLNKYFPPRTRSLNSLLGDLRKESSGPYQEFEGKGIDRRYTSKAEITEVKTEEFEHFKIWSCSFEIDGQTFFLSGRAPTVLFEDCFFDLFYEIRMTGPFSSMKMDEWTKFCGLALGHDWLIGMTGEDLSISLTTSDDQALEYLIRLESGKTLGVLHLEWDHEGQPLFNFIFS